MNPKELMIGDWVYSTFCDKPCKVIGIEQYESEYVNVKVTNVTGAKDINSLYFIPLTAEILEKNGWKYNELPFIQGWEQFGLLLYAGGEGYRINCGNNVAMRIDAVHELQHALRLCGIDKDIIL